MTQAAAIQGRTRFKAEAAEARRLGCRLEVRTEPSPPVGSMAYARVVPLTPKAAHHLARAAAADGQPGRRTVEVRQPYTDPRQVLDALDSAINLALSIARNALN